MKAGKKPFSPLFWIILSASYIIIRPSKKNACVTESDSDLHLDCWIIFLPRSSPNNDAEQYYISSCIRSSVITAYINLFSIQKLTYESSGSSLKWA